MPTLPRWSSLIVLPLISFFDATAYYVSRSSLYAYLAQDGRVGSSDVGTVLTATTVVGFVGMLLAGLSAVAVGPWVPMAVGAGVLALGAGALFALPPDLAMVGAMLIGLGHGALRPAVVGAAVRAFPDFRTEQARNATLLAVWGGVNVGAMMGPWTGQLFLGETAVFGLSAAFGFGAAVLALGLGGVVWATRKDEDADGPAPRRKDMRHLVVLAAVMLLAVIPWSTYSVAYDLLFGLVAESSGGFSEYQALTFINPISVSLLSVVGAGAALVLHFLKVRLPSLLPIGVGLILISAGTVVFLGVESVDDGLLTPALLVISAGEVLVGPLLYARIGGDLPKRLPTLAIALFFILSQAPNLVLRVVDSSRPIAWVGLVVTGLVGVVFAVAAFPLQKILLPVEATAPKEF